MLPAFMGYMQAAPTLGTEGRWANAQNLMGGYNARAGTKHELVSIDARNPTLWTIKDGDTGETQVIDVPAMIFPDNAEVATMAGSMYPTYQKEQQREDQRLGIQQAHLGVAQSHEAREQQKFAMEQSINPAEKKYQEAASSEQAKKNIEYVEQKRDAGEKAVPLLKIVDDLNGMIEGGKVRAGAGGWNTLLRKYPELGNVVDKKGMTETQKYDAATRWLAGTVNNSGIKVSNVPEFEELVIKPLPSVEKNPGAIKDILGRLGKSLKSDVMEAHKVEAHVSRSQGHVPRDIRSRATQRVEVIAPDGRRALIPADQVQAAVKKGFRVNAGS
jgi:hypothetical protein